MYSNPQNKPASADQAVELGLKKEEFMRICEVLGRIPNFTELSIYSVMWSEHCSYKNSIYWLKKLPKDGPHMLVKAGEENAGLVDIGDGLACAFKIESHNHPSALEPYQGAATGVGGINRDIFTMGARPIAQMNSLRFGPFENTRTKWLLKGVVKGIGDYGNSFGIPVLSGEVSFDECYDQNPLVNAFSAGIMSVDDLISATASGIGNPVFIVGSSTGKDGIHGAAFASKDMTEDSMDDLPAVQVGDPFQEKLLLEASLELSKTNAVVGMQDMGAAGITCSSSEMSAAGNVGMKIDLDKVPTRQSDMKDWEILLSESQERMLVVVEKGKEDIVKEIFDKWDLNCELIGEVIEGDLLEFYKDGNCVASLPPSSLVLGGGAPQYQREYKEPSYFKKYQKFDIRDVKEPDNLVNVGKFLFSQPNIASKKWIYEQYDSMVGTNNASTTLSFNNSPTVELWVYIEKALEKYLIGDKISDVFTKFVPKELSIGLKNTIDDDVKSYIKQNILKVYSIDTIELSELRYRNNINSFKLLELGLNDADRRIYSFQNTRNFRTQNLVNSNLNFKLIYNIPEEKKLTSISLKVLLRKK